MKERKKQTADHEERERERERKLARNVYKLKRVTLPLALILFSLMY